MKLSKRPGRKSVYIFVIVTCAVLSALSFVRAQSGVPTPSVVPLRPLAALSSVPTPDVPELPAYLLDKTAAIQLGKTLFWDMQAGSDGVQACASCHFNAGADSRTMNTINPGQAGGDVTFQLGVHKLDGTLGPDYQLHAGSPTAGFGGYHDGDFPTHKQLDVETRNQPGSDVNDVIGSQGVFSTKFDSIVLGDPSCALKVTKKNGEVKKRKGACASSVDGQTVTSSSVYSFPDPANPSQLVNTRQVTGRNTPSIVNAVFNDRNFWDGRAMNTCNGANPFGDRDTTSHFFFAPNKKAPIVTFVRLTNSALCSQALGPALSSVEMSAAGRNFKELGKKLLALNPLTNNTAKTTPLALQDVDPQDSVLRSHKGTGKKGLKTSYQALIQAAFQPQWWQSDWRICMAANGSETLRDPRVTSACPAGSADYSQMEYNFSVFWGIAIQQYESTLRADQTPLDQMLAKQNTYTITGNDVNNAFSVKLAAKVTPMTVAALAFNPNLDVSDQSVFAFDDGNGNIVGEGVTVGRINYATGDVSLIFDLPPNSAFPVKISYSVGAVALTKAQLHGLLLFQTKGKCIACHGGPELTNASVGHVAESPMERMLMGDFSVKIYDPGFYHIGVRKGAEDIGLGGGDGIPGSGLPLSRAEYWRQQVCNDPTLNIMIPGRLGEFIQPGPLNCYDDIAQVANFKTPSLRNVALTAPYFHNGGQLTLEQVVEFYDRGGDFPDGDELFLMDPNIQPLGFTPTEKADLVDFLRNALTDSRTVSQAAPFDHPQLFVPNGHPANPNGYPIVNDRFHPGQATDQSPLLTIPAVGKSGGAPIPTFLQNLAP